MIQAEQMDKERIMAATAKFQKVFSESDLNALGKEIGLCERERTITPFKPALSVVTSFACNQILNRTRATPCFYGSWSGLGACRLRLPFGRDSPSGKKEKATWRSPIIRPVCCRYCVSRLTATSIK
jgi:hypothetical protein